MLSRAVGCWFGRGDEVLLECLCHNLSMLTMAIHEIGVEPQFWTPRQVNA
jgi:hypothetical protein